MTEDTEWTGITWEVPQLASDHNQWRNWTVQPVRNTEGTKVYGQVFEYLGYMRLHFHAFL